MDAAMVCAILSALQVGEPLGLAQKHRTSPSMPSAGYPPVHAKGSSNDEQADEVGAASQFGQSPAIFYSVLIDIQRYIYMYYHSSTAMYIYITDYI